MNGEQHEKHVLYAINPAIMEIQKHLIIKARTIKIVAISLVSLRFISLPTLPPTRTLWLSKE